MSEGCEGQVFFQRQKTRGGGKCPSGRPPAHRNRDGIGPPAASGVSAVTLDSVDTHKEVVGGGPGWEMKEGGWG